MPADPRTRIINSTAPVRVCDNGGWTDTWFAGHGKVFSIAVAPRVEVQMKVTPHEPGTPRISIHAENYGQRFVIDPPSPLADKHPLLNAAFDYLKIPPDLSIEATVYSEMPAGCSTGTSAAVSVALTGALDHLRGTRLTAHEVALAAQRIETELLKQQCGIQDQLASAYGGVNFIEMHQYPHASVSPLGLSTELTWELESRLVLIYVGESHVSSDVHKLVISELEGSGPANPKLQALRVAAERAKEAVLRGDLAELGRSMISNTYAQANLHPDLVGVHHQRIIDIARDHQVLGWKVNGAGGAGGSVTLLCRADRTARRTMIRQIQQSSPQYAVIPIRLSPAGLRRWETVESL